jgi:osmoprotectant transport system substrate-binding protein
MEKTYGYEFPEGNVTVLDTGIVYSAADKQDPCNFGEVFTSDGRVSALDLTVLEDDQGFFPLYNPSPVFTDDVYSEYGEELDAIFDPISEALTQEEMTSLNERVSVDLEQPADVAEEWMSDNGFI